VALHHEKATLLGYPNYATFATGASVMKDLEGVRKLLLKFKDRVSRTGQTESLTKAKLNDTEVIDKTLYPWDKLYYRKKSLKADYAVHCAKVSEYFPLDSTIRAMFTILEELFGIEFEKYTGDVWHEDVELLSVWDNEDLGGEFLGYLYLDLFERPGKPRAGKSEQ
jgi:metallopeptidase MepB